jgi:hypothetical protein
MTRPVRPGYIEQTAACYACRLGFGIIGGMLMWNCFSWSSQAGLEELWLPLPIHVAGGNQHAKQEDCLHRAGFDSINCAETGSRRTITGVRPGFPCR